MTNRTIGIIGAGSIGIAFAVVFARAGNDVYLYEPNELRRQAIPDDVTLRLETLDMYGLLPEPINALEPRITVMDNLPDTVKNAQLVQECIPEQLEMKQELFESLANHIDKGCVVASSTSFIPPSKMAYGTGIEDQILVAHPGNPPYAIPIVELVPNQKTRPEILVSAEHIYTAAGMSPVRVHQETEGFIFNRLQGALLREAYSLVQEGVASVDDIDTVVRDGLGRRWAFMGPFETADLNTRGGISAHALKMGPAYHRMGLARGDTSEWNDQLVAEVTAQRRKLLPLEDWESRVAWRDAQLLQRLANQENPGKE